MNLETYDFAKPGRLDLAVQQRLMAWQTVVAALAPKKWVKALPFELEFVPATPTTVRSTGVLEKLPENVIAYRVVLPPESTTLFIFPRVFAVGIMEGLMGDSSGASAQDRELTAVEESLFQLFLQTYLLPVLREAWPGKHALACTLDRLEPNVRWSRVLNDAGILVDLSLTMRGVSGEQTCQWLVPQKSLYSLLGEPMSLPVVTPKSSTSTAATIESLVQEVPVEFTVQLGSAELSFTQLGNLAVGDTVILGQRITEPLVASVGAGCRFHGWAGRIGEAQAFQIESLANAD